MTDSLLQLGSHRARDRGLITRSILRFALIVGLGSACSEQTEVEVEAERAADGIGDTTRSAAEDLERGLEEAAERAAESVRDRAAETGEAIEREAEGAAAELEAAPRRFARAHARRKRPRPSR